MKQEDMLLKFPTNMPPIVIQKADYPFFEVKFEENSFIVPRIGNTNAYGVYRAGELALVSTCRVPKKARIHNAEGVQICRDTYHVKKGKSMKNECIWFVQLTDQALLTLAVLRFVGEQEAADIPTEIHTFLDKDFDTAVNGNGEFHGMPLWIRENPVQTDETGIRIPQQSLRYTAGTYDLTIGSKTFETVKFMILQGDAFKEFFVDRNGRLILMRWYQSQTDVFRSEIYPQEFKERIRNNPLVTVNGEKYILTEDRLNEYVFSLS